jgi:uncharacterized protein YndB with AHSA1/START domain
MNTITIPPVRKEVTVAASADHAFRVFTEGVDKWWPNFLTEVEATFTSVGPKQTVVVLEHRNLERFGERAMELRNGIDAEGGWGIILQSFVAASES